MQDELWSVTGLQPQIYNVAFYDDSDADLRAEYKKKQLAHARKVQLVKIYPGPNFEALGRLPPDFGLKSARHRKHLIVHNVLTDPVHTCAQTIRDAPRISELRQWRAVETRDEVARMLQERIDEIQKRRAALRQDMTN